MITKKELDILVKKYETKDFIKDDPIQFICNCKDKKDAEIYGFIASSFAFGNRSAFIKSLNNIFNLCDNDLYCYVINGDFGNLKGTYYRIYKDLLLQVTIQIKFSSVFLMLVMSVKIY